MYNVEQIWCIGESRNLSIICSFVYIYIVYVKNHVLLNVY